MVFTLPRLAPMAFLKAVGWALAFWVGWKIVGALLFTGVMGGFSFFWPGGSWNVVMSSALSMVFKPIITTGLAWFFFRQGVPPTDLLYWLMALPLLLEIALLTSLASTMIFVFRAFVVAFPTDIRALLAPLFLLKALNFVSFSFCLIGLTAVFNRFQFHNLKQ